MHDINFIFCFSFLLLRVCFVCLFFVIRHNLQHIFAVCIYLKFVHLTYCSHVRRMVARMANTIYKERCPFQLNRVSLVLVAYTQTLARSHTSSVHQNDKDGKNFRRCSTAYTFHLIIILCNFLSPTTSYSSMAMLVFALIVS